MSSLTTLARPYAKAAFELARDRKVLPEWDALLANAGDVVADESMASLLGNPLVSSAQVTGILTDSLGGELDEAFGKFLDVLGENNRLSLFPEISRLFRQLKEEAEKRLSVRVVSAIALEDDQAERMKDALARRFEREIEMVSEIDASVLGGAVIYAGDQVIDGSLLGRLKSLENSLAS